MKQLLPALALLALLGLSVPLPSQGPQSAANSFAFDVVLEPLDGGIYRCSAVVVDLETDQVVAAPTITFRRGEDATVQSGAPGGLMIEATVAVNDDESRALYSTVIRRAGETVHSQSFAVELRGGS